MNMNAMVKETRRKRWKYFEVCRRLTLTNHRLRKKKRGATQAMHEIMAADRMKDVHPWVKE